MCSVFATSKCTTCSWWKGFPCHQQSLHIVCKSFPKLFASLFSSCWMTIWCDGVSHVCFEVLFSPHHTHHGLRLQCTMYHCARCAMCSSLLCSSWINLWCVTYISSKSSFHCDSCFQHASSLGEHLLGFEVFFKHICFVMELQDS